MSFPAGDALSHPIFAVTPTHSVKARLMSFAFRPRGSLFLASARLLATTLLFGALSASAAAQPPAVNEFSPLAAKPGETINISAVGGSLDGATELWTTCAGKSTLAPGIDNNGKDGARCTFAVTVPADAPLGL